MILSDGVNSVTIPEEEFLWTDELGWDPLVQSLDYTVVGALIVEEWAMQAGRPITLEPLSNNRGWLLRSAWLVLDAWRNVPGKMMTLTLADASTHQVIFGRPALEAVEPLFGFTRRYGTEYWRGKIRLLKVG